MEALGLSAVAAPSAAEQTLFPPCLELYKAAMLCLRELYMRTIKAETACDRPSADTDATSPDLVAHVSLMEAAATACDTVSAGIDQLGSLLYSPHNPVEQRQALVALHGAIVQVLQLTKQLGAPGAEATARLSHDWLAALTACRNALAPPPVDAPLTQSQTSEADLAQWRADLDAALL